MTFTCGLRCNGLVAPWVLSGPMNGDTLRVYVEKVLAPTLSPGDIHDFSPKECQNHLGRGAALRCNLA